MHNKMLACPLRSTAVPLRLSTSAFAHQGSALSKSVSRAPLATAAPAIDRSRHERPAQMAQPSTVAATSAAAPAAPLPQPSLVANGASPGNPKVAISNTQHTQDVQSTQQQNPGRADAERFRLHWSVDMWHNFKHEPEELLAAQTSAEKSAALLRLAASYARKAGVLESPTAATYWIGHIGRSTFFALQGIAGLSLANGEESSSASPVARRSALPVARLNWKGLTGLFKGNNMHRPVVEALAVYYQDYENIRAGLYKAPWDMSPTHRQFNPLFLLRNAAAFFEEARATLSRRTKGQPEDVWLSSSSNLYPDYYLKSFHYQTDGWLSARSANVYETSTETVFIGRQDGMQRQSLVPIAEHLRAAGASGDGAGLRLLEVGCGTGRFLTFIKDNWPRMDVTGLDLSPFYLAKARDNMRYWKQQRATDLKGLGGVDDCGAGFVQAAAESIPAPDNSYDLVVSVYLFHELPHDVRCRAISEMCRVVKPGGLVVITDSTQLGDRPAQDAYMGNFTKFNEPHYQGYIEHDLGKAFEEHGLHPDLKLLASSSKVLSFWKSLSTVPKC